MELIRSWLMGITATAMIAAVADVLAPEGAIKKVGKLAGGLLLILAILRPVVTLDDAMLAGSLANYRLEAVGYSRALETENQRLMEAIIAEQTGAYILDKAEELGMPCTVEVSCQRDDTGNSYPASVRVCGTFTAGQVEALCRVIQRELAIPAKNQQYERIEKP